ncbi:MAG: DUF4197 domain-containing protein [Pseudopedobacter saltans]|uniref:DUF4197 domain-containing protein n=1 Tax=Pseudopedobacter saltans TaxID=151895 RepID=A0A2W5F825_9SPHI|nr:MAG: DUF4197 domain-containing protein [Pseudopedobacter saltans]
MRKILLLSFSVLCLGSQFTKAQNLGSLLKTVTSKTSSKSTNNNLTESEANSGVKELLSTGLVNSVTALNKTDAFWKSAYKILLPEPLHTADGVLRKLNMGGVADSAELRMNRAAEQAVGFAKPIFVNAIKQMTLTDAIKLVNGGNNSITDFFRAKTHDTLVNAFMPTIQTELNKNKATSSYSQLVTKYNAVPFVKKANPDLSSYVAGKAVDALFDQISVQEKKHKNESSSTDN